MTEPTQEELLAVWKAQQDDKAGQLQDIVAAFKGIELSPEQLGIFGGDQAVKMDLGQYLIDTFTERQSLTVTVQQEVFIEIGKRMKGLAEQLTGATWSG
jgi:hypothetical protein